MIYIQHLLFFFQDFKYPILFLGTIFEGPILMVASGFFIRTGFLSLIPTFFVVMAGDLVGDIGWYFIGRNVALPVIERYGHFFGFTPEVFDKAKELFKKYHSKILLISKITIGLGMSLATLITAGATRISFKRYMVLNAIGEFILVSILISVGYFFGNIYTSLSDSVKNIFIICDVVIISLVIYGFRKYMRRKIADL